MATTTPAGADLISLYVQANSPHNDSWTREFYQKEYEKFRRQMDMERFSQKEGDYELPPHTD